MASITEAWAAGRAEKVARPPRQPVLLKLAALAARRLPRWRQVRTAVLGAAGFGFLDYAVWGWNHLVGYAAIGASLLLLELLDGGKKR